jgi:hypothetical protein
MTNFLKPVKILLAFQVGLCCSESAADITAADITAAVSQLQILQQQTADNVLVQ